MHLRDGSRRNIVLPQRFNCVFIPQKGPYSRFHPLFFAAVRNKPGLTTSFGKEKLGPHPGKTGATPLENYSHAQQGEARSPGTSPASVCHIFEYVTSPVVHYGIVGRRRVRAIARNIVFFRDHRPRDAKPAFRDALS